MADEATDYTEVNRANEADAADKPGKAGEAKANASDKAKANEANEAIVANEIDEAIEYDEFEADVIVEITATNKAIVINKVIAVGVTKDAEVDVKASEAVEIEADWVDEAILTDKVNKVNATDTRCDRHG